MVRTGICRKCGKPIEIDNRSHEDICTTCKEEEKPRHTSKWSVVDYLMAKY